MTKYTIERKCLSCGNKEEIHVSKREAAFELVDINAVLGESCKKCRSVRFTTNYLVPELDYELLKDWATNSELYLMPQDEELLLADGRYFDNILAILDTVSIPDHKRNILMEALCIIIYDNSVKENLHQDTELKNKVIQALNNRMNKLKSADGWISDYIKKVVYPQLDIDPT